jgi:dienelactone hydrolase
MRPLEMVLILVNLLSLSLAIKRRSRATWLVIAGINLLVLLIHGAIEGLRYEMAYSYIFVFLLVVAAAAQASGRFSGARIPKALTVSAVGLSFLLLAMTSYLAYALPVFTCPKLTGGEAVGIRYYELVDENRRDPFLDKSPQKRNLMVKVFYPAKDDSSKPFSPYFHGSAGLIRAMAQFYHLPVFVFHHLGLVKTRAKDGLEISGRQPSYPMVLFSHGAGASMEVETSQSEDLASHGYIVVDVDHTYVSMATEFPGRIVTAQEATTNFDTPEPAEPITQIMADDDKFVIDELGQMNTGKLDSAFKGKLNLDEIGVIGHSVGGAVAYNLAINDSRVKAAINLDGAVYITPKDPKQIAPFLMLANDQYHVQAIAHRECLMEKVDSSPDGQRRMLDMFGSEKAYDDAYSRAQQNISGLADVLRASGNFYTIEGSDHMKFTDIGLFIGSPWLRNLMQIRGKCDPARCLVITEALTVAFFDRYLKGQSTDSLPSLLKAYPELKKVNLE